MTRGDCTYFMGERESDGVTPLRVECVWDHIDPDKIDALFGQVAGYDAFIWAIEDTRQVSVDGARSLVWQRHSVPGTAPREVQLWMETQPTEAGGMRYSWTTAGTPFSLGKGAIRAPRNDGYWEVSVGEAGIEVVLQASYNPGGWVPDWLVRWCQTIGAERMMNDIQSLAAATS